MFWFGKEINSKKSKVMVNWSKGNKGIGRKVVREISDYHIKIEFGECEEYTYLGFVISIRGTI